jgi:hypothetical protein
VIAPAFRTDRLRTSSATRAARRLILSCHRLGS